ncbi:hypothetical protein GGS20DRAFT_507843 [Poronia punctata]|nr:hypothetical protein GGS20DRAFT_507843 [Poronia punctata]
MRVLRQPSNCAGLLLLVLAMTQQVEATPASDNEWEVLWVEKSYNVFQHAKRREYCPQDGWSLCPPSVNGGCCPDGFACESAACHATTGGAAPCPNSPGYYSCPITAGPGGCCKLGTVCGSGVCIPPPDGPAVSCPADSFACPASLGGGCCRTGQNCGHGICFYATPKTDQVTEGVTTTDSRGRETVTVVTRTTTYTEGPITTGSSSLGATTIPQFFPSTVSKIEAQETDDSSSGATGLSSGALGGIVAGVIVLLVSIIGAATFIILRLKRAERAAKAAEAAAESKRESSNSRSRSHKPGFGQPSVSEIDTVTDIDSQQFPIMGHSPRPRTRTLSSVAGGASRSTPNFTISGTSSPPPLGIFNYVPSEFSDGRQSSLDSYGQRDNNNNSRVSHRISADADQYLQYGHSRHPSETSELEGPHGTSELETLDAEAEARRRSGSATRAGIKPQARWSGDSSGPARGRGDSNAPAASLDTVNEIHELHGHYGPPDAVSGQTAARLDKGHSSSSGNDYYD